MDRNDFATKRDAYYQSKNWGDARFDEQTESDAVMDDVEALFSTYDVSREELRFYPEEHGGAVAGELIVVDADSETGEAIEIDCTKFGSGAYSIPSSVEHLRFRTDAKFILAIETGGVFQRLNYHKYWQHAKCIAVVGSAHPRDAPLHPTPSEHRGSLPACVYAFTDCDPYAFANIYRTLKVGSGNAATSAASSACRRPRSSASPAGHPRPQAMDATHVAGRGRQGARRTRLKNGPFFLMQPKWRRGRSRQQMQMGVRAEQQAFAVGPQLRDGQVPPPEAQEPQVVPSLKSGLREPLEASVRPVRRRGDDATR